MVDDYGVEIPDDEISESFSLKDGRDLLIREACPEDAGAILDYVEEVSGETDFLSFGPGEFKQTKAAEEAFLRQCRNVDHQLFLLGLVEGMIVSALTFSAGNRPRVRHRGEFGISVRKDHWSLGIGSLMLDTLLVWAKHVGRVKKINLRVRTDNHRAIALYKSKGFVIEGTIHKEICIDGQFYHHHWMGLALSE